MDQKSIMLTRKRMNELASSHNKLTTLVACLLNEINYLKRDVYETRGSNDNSNTQQQTQTRAEEILKQLTINTSDN